MLELMDIIHILDSTNMIRQIRHSTHHDYEIISYHADADFVNLSVDEDVFNNVCQICIVLSDDDLNLFVRVVGSSVFNRLNVYSVDDFIVF